MSKGGKPPAPADYKGAAEAQGRANIEATRVGAALNRVGQITPYGSVSYRRAGSTGTEPVKLASTVPTSASSTAPTGMNSGGPKEELMRRLKGEQPGNPGATPTAPYDPSQDMWEQVTTLSPEQQAIFNSQQRNQQGQLDSAGQRLQSFNGQQPLDSYNPGDFGAQRDQVTNTLYGQATRMMDPQFQQREDALRTRLLNSGIREGSEAYNSEMDNFGRGRDTAYADARDRAILAGGQEQSRLLAEALRGRQQQVSERQIPLEEYLALSGVGGTGMQPGAIPQVGGPEAAPYFDAIGRQSADQLQRWNFDQAQDAQTMGTAANLGMLAYLAYATSDRRLKTDIERVGALDSGIPVYTFRYNWDEPGTVRTGVMADEVVRVTPEAVREIDGYLAVDYSQIGAGHLLETLQ